jgi:hypothetical protein
MGIIAKPDGLQSGSATKELYDELHYRHALAGWPSPRELAKKLPISAASIYNVFRGRPLLPLRPNLLHIVLELAKLALNPDVQGEKDRFGELWNAARTEEEARAASDASVSD